jgi:predicted metal-dependent phosphoesterase TrpH
MTPAGQHTSAASTGSYRTVTSKVDLHIHTTASDGRLTPEEVVQRSAELGLAYIAITDHDTVSGIERALQANTAFPSMTVIPGLEINTDTPTGEVHILGYFIDYKNAELGSSLNKLRHSRETRARKIIENLSEMGIEVSWEQVMELAGGGSVGRPHIAQAMFEGGYIPSLQEAFIKYIGRHGPAYAERERLSPREAVKLIVTAGGLASLAHPEDIEELDVLLDELKEEGLVGIETFYDNYHLKTIERLAETAAKSGLITTGGSDFHDLGSSHETPLGGVDVPIECAERLINLAKQRSREVAG